MEYLTYGDHKEQFIEVYQTDDNANWLAVVHGGYWRQRIGVEKMHPFVEKLVHLGFNVVNIEYRRGEHPWPTPETDVQQALETFKSSEYFPAEGQLTVIGHSVGGQLAFNNAQYADYIVALGPVTDVKFTRDHHLGDDAALEYFGDASDEALYQASPLSRLPLNVPTLILHGVDDDKVLIDTTFDYIEQNEGDVIDLLAPAKLDHMVAIEPDMPFFDHMVDWIRNHSL